MLWVFRVLNIAWSLFPSNEMVRKLEMTLDLPVPPGRLYRDWLDSAAHSSFTGSPALMSSELNEEYTAWDGYIKGKNLELQAPKRIKQTWRTTDFPEDAPNSLLELVFEPVGEHTRLILRHSDIPDGQADQYEEGWMDYYFNPMREYYSK